MFMLCYKNGGLARERIRDALSKPSPSDDPWTTFNSLALITPPLGQSTPSSLAKLGLFFPLPEIVPNVREGTWRYTCIPYDGSNLRETQLEEESAAISQDLLSSSSSPGGWSPADDARAIIESQILSLRLRSQKLVHSPGAGLPAQPRRIYLVGGGSLNSAIARIVGDVLGGTEGVWRLDVGGNACALGAAYKAVWAVERKVGESFEELIGERWREGEAVEKIGEGYRADVWDKYGRVLNAFEEMEKRVLAGEERNK
jgi:xylulokinase